MEAQTTQGAHKVARRETELLRAAVAACPGMLFLFGAQAGLLQCSEAGLRLLGAEDAGRLRGAAPQALFAPVVGHPAAGRLAEGCARAAGQGGPVAYEDTLALADGGELPVKVEIRPLPGDAGAAGVLLYMADMTELDEARHRAEEATRSKMNFLANMSHEIRTPLNAIKGLSDLLALTELDNLQRNYVNNIIASACALVNIINDILDFSKINAGGLELAEGPYSTAEMLAEVSNMAAMRSEEKGLLLLVDASPRLPATLWGDDVRIKQVLVNLLGNAVKYTPAGQVRLGMRYEQQAGGGRLVCSVADSGQGIPDEEMEKLFEAFTRADLQANRSIAGAGLGLAITRHLVAAMGGEITVESEYGAGTTFRFWVPQRVVDPTPLAALVQAGEVRVLLCGDEARTGSLAAAIGEMGAVCTQLPADAGAAACRAADYTHCIYTPEATAKTLRQLRAAGPGCLFAAVQDMGSAAEVSGLDDAVLLAPVLPPDLARFLNRRPENQGEEPAALPADDPLAGLRVRDTRLLVVDDNEPNLIVGSEMLRTFGAEVDCAGGGAEAVEMCGRTRYDIIFMDHMMPGMDGIEVTVHLRSHPGPNQQTPIVALTANVLNNMQSFYVRSGMDDFIPKPVAFEELARVLCRWLPPEKLQAQPDAAACRTGEGQRGGW